MSRIVETDNFGRDYPNESFVNIPRMPKDDAQAIADIINKHVGPNCSRYWKVVENDYELAPAFEP